jgi:hypothetical protein
MREQRPNVRKGQTMRRSRTLLAIAMLSGALALPAQAQKACPEGRTFSGACVNTTLAQAMRKQTFAYTQPKFSYTAPPWLPSEDGEYYVPRDYNEIRTLFGPGSAGGVPGCTPPIGSRSC